VSGVLARHAALVAMGAVTVLGINGVHAQPGPTRALTPPSRVHVHEVRPGDTLSAIARRYGATVDALVAANKLPSARATLRVGQRLVVPVAPPPPATATRRVQEAAPGSRARRPESAKPPPTLTLEVPDFDEIAPHFVWPVDGAVTSAFGRRRQGWHGGVDVQAEPGAPVRASAAGVVIASGVEPRYGLVVKIEHDGGFVTVYAHNHENRVEVGDAVASGAIVASVGRTGRASSYHLHFEIRRNGRSYNPLYLLPLPPRIARLDEATEPPDDE
jgi:murein DD-endopeptidase MepM/ murein hydrolase activator NlpD